MRRIAFILIFLDLFIDRLIQSAQWTAACFILQLPIIIMKAQISMISVVIISGIIIALIGVAYTWAVPMIEKRVTITEYELLEDFMLELNEKIVDIANTGSGEAIIAIPSGILEVRGYELNSEVNNTITLDFFVSQPIMTENGSVPIETSSLDYIGEYGKTEPRVIMLSRSYDERYTHLNISMRYRELRSSAPKGYIIALCPSSGCNSIVTGGNDVTVSFDKTVVEERDPFSGGPLTVIYMTLEVT
jgi:hypothetical protein